jgi:hypothetical protein
MTSEELRNCDDELKAAARALKDNMHALPPLAELAHHCVVANDLGGALVGLELPQPACPPGLCEGLSDMELEPQIPTRM